MPSVLIADDDATIREVLAEFFAALGWHSRAAASATEARAAAAEDAPDLALVDLRLPDASGLTLLEALRADDPAVSVIVLTGHGDVATAVRAMQQGAADFLEKPVNLDALQAAAEQALELGRLKRELGVLRAREAPSAEGAAPDASLERLIALAARNGDVPVLIVGETGTGKGWVARRIHQESAQREAPFVEINCASLSATFVESELFGHERGAFTDARQAKRGLFEVASRGSVFLDEVGELALEVQPRLLKALEERRFRRLGGTVELTTDARMIAATNVPLRTRVEEGRFRADLFYRLQVLTIELPPLRERQGDLRALTQSLLPAGARLATDAKRVMERYPWPGNVRELKNVLWRAALLADGAPIGVRELGLPPTTVGTAPSLTLNDAEQRAIELALANAKGNKTRAAELLGIARSTLNEKLRRKSDDQG
ncbi:MAG: Fis family transcriptional regulator [Gemmatimonadetes bacterium]|nr:Fis family transcriptional regulator [Gemmatimonadota bacterium]